MQRRNLTEIFYDGQLPLNHDIVFIILEMAGVVSYARKHSCFTIFFGHLCQDGKKAERAQETKPVGYTRYENVPRQQIGRIQGGNGPS